MIYNYTKKCRIVRNKTEVVKDLYFENYKALMKEIEDDTQNGKIFQAHGLEKQILLKYLYHPKQSTQLIQSL